MAEPCSYPFNTGTSTRLMKGLLEVGNIRLPFLVTRGRSLFDTPAAICISNGPADAARMCGWPTDTLLSHWPPGPGSLAAGNNLRIHRQAFAMAGCRNKRPAAAQGPPRGPGCQSPPHDWGRAARLPVDKDRRSPH